MDLNKNFAKNKKKNMFFYNLFFSTTDDSYKKRSSLWYNVNGNDIISDFLLTEITPHYYCPQCNRKYIHRKYMLSHMKYECGKPPMFKCILCGYGSKRKFNLKLHMSRMHGDRTSCLNVSQGRKLNMAGFESKEIPF